MDDSEGKSPSDGVPKWQLNAPHDEATADAPQSQQESQEDKLEVARRFLDDEAVKTAPRDTKVGFLKSKGVEDEDIEHLLGGLEEAPSSSAKDSTPTDESNQKALQVLEKSFAPKQPAAPAPDSTPAGPEPSNSILAGSDRPPVVTYPEFLTKPQRTPPLVTTNGLLNTLYAFGGLSALLYGTTKFAVEPMVEKLTNARIDLHETTSSRLDSILTQLESTVSVIPSYKNSGANAASEATESDDPSEMFHRDVGTQTSSFPTSSSSQGKDEAQSKLQADRLSKLAKSLKGLTEDFKSQSTDSEDIKVLLDVFRDDLDNMTYGYHAELFGNFDKRKKKTDSEDEIRKVRDNIRRIKGVLLSARTFPTSAR
ncbi:peroxisomal membrane anchor protein conserved region domain-containing protein [Trichoderma barbatum]